VRELQRGVVFDRGGVERVCKLHGRVVFGGGGVYRVRGVSRRHVLVGRRERVCQLHGRVVLYRARRERVRRLPEFLVVGARIDVNRKLRLQRRVLRRERRRVHVVCGDVHVSARQPGGGGLRMRREPVYQYYRDSEPAVAMRGREKHGVRRDAIHYIECTRGCRTRYRYCYRF
jgi:hypothetical protein